MSDIEIAAQVLAALVQWVVAAFNSLDQCYFMGFSILNIMIASAVFDITWHGVRRIINSPKSDA